MHPLPNNHMYVRKPEEYPCRCVINMNFSVWGYDLGIVYHIYKASLHMNSISCVGMCWLPWIHKERASCNKCMVTMFRLPVHQKPHLGLAWQKEIATNLEYWEPKWDKVELLQSLYSSICGWPPNSVLGHLNLVELELFKIVIVEQITSQLPIYS